MKRNILKMLSVGVCGILTFNTLNAQSFPPNGTVEEEIQIGGPSSDYLTLQFPRADNLACGTNLSERRTVGGDLDKYGKALLVVIFPENCPYCIIAANEAEPIIAKYRDKLTVWYANANLNGPGNCTELQNMKNKYTFVRNADFSFVDSYIYQKHYPQQNTYWTRKESPSVYRIFSPKTKKVTGINYYVGPIENQIKAAIAENLTVTSAEAPNANLSSYEMYPNPTNDRLNLNFHLKTSNDAVISITNTLGKEVMRKDVSSATSFNQEIDINELQNDIYMISVTSGGNTIISDRFVKF